MRTGESLLTEPPEAPRALEAAPLHADAAGLAILACLRSPSDTKINIYRIREEDHAVGCAPLRGRTMIAAPSGTARPVADSIAPLAGDAQMKRPSTRARYVAAVMDAAAVMSGQL